MKERYYSTIEFVDRYGKANKEVAVYTELGKRPTVGDFIEAFRSNGLDVELKDFVSMVFKPVNPSTSPIISLRIIRTLKDHTYSNSSYDRTAFK